MKKLLIKLKSLYSKMPAGVKASIWFTFCSVLQKGISLITVPVFTRLLTTEQYGQYTLYQSWLGIVSIFATLNLSAGVFNNGMLKYKDNKDKYISSMQGLSTVTTILVLLVYLVKPSFWNSLMELPTIVIMAMLVEILFTPSFQYWSMRQRYEFKYKFLVLITIIVSVCNPIVGLIAVNNTVEKGIARILTVTAVNSIVGLLFYFYNFGKGKFFFDKDYWTFALKFNLPLIPHYLSSMILSQSDRIMIGKMFGVDKVAMYSVAYSISMIMNILVSSVNASFVPWTYQKCADKNFEEVGTVSKTLLVFIGIVCLIPVLMAPEVIRIMAPESYRGAEWVIPPVAMSIYFIFLYSLFGNIEFYFEESKFVMIASVISAASNILLNLIFMPIFGYIAAGYTTLVCYAIYALSHFTFMKLTVKKKLGRDVKIYDTKFIEKLTICMIGVCAAIMVLYNFPIVRYTFLMIIITGLVYNRKKVLNAIKN